MQYFVHVWFDAPILLFESSYINRFNQQMKNWAQFMNSIKAYTAYLREDTHVLSHVVLSSCLYILRRFAKISKRLIMTLSDAPGRKITIFMKYGFRVWIMGLMEFSWIWKMF